MKIQPSFFCVKKMMYAGYNFSGVIFLFLGGFCMTKKMFIFVPYNTNLVKLH